MYGSGPRIGMTPITKPVWGVILLKTESLLPNRSAGGAGAIHMKMYVQLLAWGWFLREGIMFLVLGSA